MCKKKKWEINANRTQQCVLRHGVFLMITWNSLTRSFEKLEENFDQHSHVCGYLFLFATIFDIGKKLQSDPKLPRIHIRNFITLWIRCSFEIVARQGNRIHSQGGSRHSPFLAVIVFGKKGTVVLTDSFAVCFCRLVISPWALRENTALELANQ